MTTKKSKKVESPSSTPTKGIAVLDFGREPVKPGKRPPSKYPLIEGAESLVNEILRLKRLFDAVDGPYKGAKEKLKEEFGFPQYFEKNKGRLDPPSSMVAQGSDGEARVTFKNRFTPGDQKKLEALLKELAPRWFRQHWVIQIDSDLIPAEKGPELVTALQKLMSVMELSHALVIKHGIVPVPEFAEKRHIEFDPKMNLKIQEIVPQQAAVSPKAGR